MLKTSKAGIDLIAEFEGFSSKPYLCPAKVPTIGFGSTLYADGRKVTLQDEPITRDEAAGLLAATLKTFENAVTKSVTVEIEQCQFDAMVCLCYNIGGANFKSSTLVKMLNAGDELVLVAGQFLRWNKAGGKVLAGLSRRREAERCLFLNEGRF